MCYHCDLSVLYIFPRDPALQAMGILETSCGLSPESFDGLERHKQAVVAASTEASDASAALLPAGALATVEGLFMVCRQLFGVSGRSSGGARGAVAQRREADEDLSARCTDNAAHYRLVLMKCRASEKRSRRRR